MKKFIKKIVPQEILNSLYIFKAIIAKLIFFSPGNPKIIGVTGTDGKTTTTFLIHSILEKAGYKVALCNGLVFKLKNKEWKNQTDNSTPNPFLLYKFIKQAKKTKHDYIILEVTSWGLSQNRVWGIPFCTAVFTNLTHEHLDLHHSMNEYKKSKGKLFQITSKHFSSTSIINADDEYNDYFYKFPIKNRILYGIESDKLDVKADNLNLSITKSEFDIQYRDETLPVVLNLPGRYNIFNALAAISVAVSENIDFSLIQAALKNLPLIPGRFEKIELGQNFDVIIDFAHTPNAFEQIFQTIKNIKPESNLIAVYGSAGGRDYEKRPILGKIASKYVDFNILTADDPRSENPKKIAEEIAEGLKKNNKKESTDYIFIADRKEAIKFACEKAQKDDVVVMLSMGHYEIMYVGDGKVKWSDKNAAIEALKHLGY